MRLLSLIVLAALSASAAGIPKGFKKIFNGKNTKGWHISEVNHHGNTKAWTVKDGVLMVRLPRLAVEKPRPLAITIQ